MDRGTVVRKLQHLTVTTLACVTLAALVSCSRETARREHRTFDAPEEAVQALGKAVAQGNMDEVVAIFGPEGKDLVDTSDPATARRNREVFTVAFAEGWRLVDEGTRQALVIGNEEWPFPVPIVRDEGNGWRFDTAAGREEILARRIGRNELAAIRICRTYVQAQRLYAQHPHDGKPAGLFASRVSSDPGRQNGLYWPASPGQRRSPLGELIAEAADDRGLAATKGQQSSPFHGYYFKVLTAQGAAAPGGAKPYLVAGEMSGGFALVAWPAEYDRTGVMTFVVNQDGVVHQKDLGPGTGAGGRAVALYDPDPSWEVVE